MINIDDKTRRLSQATIVIGYKQENKAESIEFEIPDYLKEYGKKICFKTKDGKVFSKLFDNTTSNIFTFTRTETQYGELDATIEFFKTENADMIIYKTSMLHIIFNESIICEDEVQPDEPKIPILESLIEKVIELNNTITENEETRNNNENTRISNENNRIANETQRDIYYTGIQNKVNNGEFNGATFTPSVDKDGNISWTNNKGLENPTSQNIRGPQGIQGPQGEAFKIKKTYPSIEAMQNDFDNMEVGDYVMIANSVEIEDNAKLYAKAETEWVFITDFSGSTGIQGEQGPQGIQGIQGERGIGISSLEVRDGSLYVTLTDNTQQNAGLIITDEVKQWLVTEITNNAESTFNQYYGTKVSDFNKTVEEQTKAINDNAQARIDEYDKHAEELTNRITTLESENEELQLECKRLREDNQAIAIIGQASGENITLNDSSEARLKKFEVGGNHSQETREGYNLLDMRNAKGGTTVGLTININENGSYSAIGTPTHNVINIWFLGGYGFPDDNALFILEAGTYYIKDVMLFHGTMNVGHSNGIYTITEDTPITGVRAPNFISGNTYNEIRYPILAKSNKELEWQPYGASPGPEFESLVKTVGQNGSVEISVDNGLETTDINYKSQTKVLPIQQEMLEGDYINEHGEHHEWIKVVLDGTENWREITTNNLKRFFYEVRVASINNTNSVNCISNYFKGTSRNKLEYSSGDEISVADKFLNILSKKIETKEDFKAWLKSKYDEGNPVIVYYKLATPVNLELTEEQKKVKKEIDGTLHTYKGTTHITISSGEINAIANVEYLKDTEKYIEDKITTALTEINANN